MNEFFIGKVYGELKITDVYRKKERRNDYYATCECLVCGAVGSSRLIDIRLGKIKSCRNYNNRVEISGSIVTLFIHNGKIIKLDKEFYLNNSNKRYHIGGKGYPNQSTGYNGTHSLVHRTVLEVFDQSIIIDHKNGDRLDNRKENLRTCTIGQNGMNQRVQKNRRIPKSSKYKGVRANKYVSKTSYYARIKKDKIEYNLGRFDNPEDVARAYDKAAIEMFGEFSCTNKQMGLL